MKRIFLSFCLFSLPSVFLISCTSHYVATEKVKSGLKRCDQGDLVTCRSMIEEALVTDPTNIRAVDAMGRIYEEEGNLAEAEAYYQEVYQRAGVTEYPRMVDGQWQSPLREEIGKKLENIRLRLAAGNNRAAKASLTLP